MKSPLLTRWRIVGMEQWDQDFVDLVSPGHITFEPGGTGQLHFGCVDAELDWRATKSAERIEFTFAGFDEGDEVSGQGWAKAEGARLTGRITFHHGDESGFSAVRGG